jgi:serine/threonine-protein kinase
MNTPPDPSSDPSALTPTPTAPLANAQEVAPGTSANTIDELRPGDVHATGSWHNLPAPASATQPATTFAIAGYECLGVLGRGGMGVVYRARQIRADRIVALKLMLHAEHANPAARARFDTEAQAVARFQHPNIVQVFEVGEANGAPFFSLEYVAGGTLGQAIKEKLLPSRQVGSLVATLARAIAYAHRSNVIHRDLKPGNILLTPEGAPKVADFGLARKIEAEAHLTHAGVVVGTPSYMAPEQASGDPNRVGPAADIYSLGAILYELLTGRAPFVGQSVLDVLAQVRSAEPVAPSALQPHVPRDLETICLKCLQKDPARRYDSAEALADDLDRYGRGEPIRARPIGRLARGVRWCRRNPAPTAVVAVALLAAGIAAWSAWTIAGQNARITAQNDDIKTQNEQIIAQNHAIAAKEKLALARLDVNRALVTAFATEVPAITDYQPFADQMKGELTQLVIRLLTESQGKADVGTLTERGLVVLATRQGDMARIERRLDEAERFYQDAYRLAQAVLASETREKGKALANLAFALIKFAELALDRRRYAEALRWYREALALRRRLVETPTGDLDPVDCQVDLGRIHHLLAEAYFVAREYAAALPEAQKGLAILEKYAPLVKDAKHADLARRDVGSAAITVGNLAFRANQLELGKSSFKKAIAIYQSQLAAHPGSLAARYNLDKAASEYGDWCVMKLNAPREALEYFLIAQQQNRALCNDPNFVNVQQTGLALGYYRLGLAMHMDSKEKEARKYFARCADLREIRLRELEAEALWGNPRRLLDARIDCMLAQARCGRVDDVLPVVQLLLKVAAATRPAKTARPEQVKEMNQLKAHYQLFACAGFAVLAETVEPADQRRADWVRQALDALRLAIDNGFENLWFLENDPDFVTLQQNTEFNTVLEPLRKRLGKKAQQTP